MNASKNHHVVVVSLMLGLLSTVFVLAEPVVPSISYPQQPIILKNSSIKAHTDSYATHYNAKSGKRLNFGKRFLKAGSASSAYNGGYTPGVETISSLMQLYNIPWNLTGSGAIAIVDAYHDPTALSDFNAFASIIGVPQEPSSDPLNSSNQVFQVVYSGGSQPPIDPTGPLHWDIEDSIDIEMAHGFAPSAKIYLVEAPSNSLGDLIHAVIVAEQLPGVTQVSTSWGFTEFGSEGGIDDYAFDTPGVTFYASTGDTGGSIGIQYPASSPNVVAVGATEIVRDSYGNFLDEIGWRNTTGGYSQYEQSPDFQQSLGLNYRTVPDISSDGSDNSTVMIVDSNVSPSNPYYYAWGSSVACPTIAALVNDQGTLNPNSDSEDNLIYWNQGSWNIRDIVDGSNGPYSCTPGYDFVTGCGVPNGLWAL